MIIGSGMLAKAFATYRENEKFIIFASGVSNSQEVQESAFQRERKLLTDTLQEHPEKTLVYFSTCSIQDPSAQHTAYVMHKKNMESIISHTQQNYYIFRLPHVVGKTTSPTVIHYLYRKINAGEHFELWSQAYRNIIDCEDVFKIADYLLSHGIYKNEISVIASPISLSIQAIVALIEKITGKTAHYSVVPKGMAYDIDASLAKALEPTLGLNFNENYLESVLKKYY